MKTSLFDIDLKNHLVTKELLLIEGKTIITEVEIDDEKFMNRNSLWTKFQGYELFIVHEEKALEVLIEEANQIHPENLSIRFSLNNIEGEELVSKIKEAINQGVAEYERQRPDQQLSLF
ncbi:MAG: hypothetical protein WBM32_06085 [Crocosphaera sp.]